MRGALWRPLNKYDKQLKIDSTDFKWLIFEKSPQAGKIATKLVKTFSISTYHEVTSKITLRIENKNIFTLGLEPN